MFSLNSCRRFPSVRVPPLDFTFGGRAATDRRSSPPLPPLSSSGKLRKRLVVRALACAQLLLWCAHARLRTIDRVLNKCIGHWRNEATRGKARMYTIVCLVIMGTTGEQRVSIWSSFLIVPLLYDLRHVFSRLSYSDNDVKVLISWFEKTAWCLLPGRRSFVLKHSILVLEAQIMINYERGGIE